MQKIPYREAIGSLMYTAFINEIPTAKLENFPGKSTPLYIDINFRLDLQGVSVLLCRGVSRLFALT